MFGNWEYPYEKYFKEPINRQKVILLEFSKRPSFQSNSQEGRNLNTKTVQLLIEEGNRIEQLSNEFLNSKSSQTNFDELTDAYNSWYESCLSLKIEENKREEFKNYYLNSIRHYLREPFSWVDPCTIDLGKKYPYRETFRLPLLEQIRILEQSSQFSENNVSSNSNSIDFIVNLSKKFHLIARELKPGNRRNRNDKPRDTIIIDDEYDVQDLFRAMLRIYFDVVMPEETMPSYALTRPRADLFLPKEEIIIELKKTRKGLNDGELRTQIIEDKVYYCKHPHFKIIMVFIFDPDGYINRPSELEHYLSDPINGVATKVIISQNPT